MESAKLLKKHEKPPRGIRVWWIERRKCWGVQWYERKEGKALKAPVMRTRKTKTEALALAAEIETARRKHGTEARTGMDTKSSRDWELIRYGYDGRGNRTTLTDANGAVTTWGYDESGRNIAKTYANGDRREMAYDAAGRLVRLTDENGRSITSVHDLAGRLVRKEFGSLASDPSPIASDIDTYAYDLASRLISVSKGRYGHTLIYGYDQAGRLATETHPDGTVLHLAYDDANRLANLSLSPIASAQSPYYSVAYAYDARGLLATVSAGDYATRYEYRSNGQLASTIDYRVIDPQADILRADRTYDAGARLTEVANTAANGDQAGVRYTLALDGQRTEAVEESGAKWQYGYDSLKQLVTAKKTDTQASVIPPLDQSYAYDPMGNRRTYADQTGSTAYTANNANQYTAVGGVASVYDRNGNLLTDGVKNYTWDAENQLTSVTPVNPTEGSAKVEYTYDWRMRRTGKKSFTYTAGNWTLTKTTSFKYHEWNPIQETITPASGSTENKYYAWGNDLSGNLHGAGGVGGLLSMKYNGENYFYAFDGNGNVRALVKADAGNPASSGVAERYAYDGFGRELPSSTPIAARLSPFAFSTKCFDAETGLNYYGRRFYDSGNGRWISRDPIKEDGGNNIYAAVGNNALNYFDLIGFVALSGLTVGSYMDHVSLTSPWDISSNGACCTLNAIPTWELTQIYDSVGSSWIGSDVSLGADDTFAGNHYPAYSTSQNLENIDTAINQMVQDRRQAFETLQASWQNSLSSLVGKSHKCTILDALRSSITLQEIDFSEEIAFRINRNSTSGPDNNGRLVYNGFFSCNMDNPYCQMIVNSN